MTTDANRLANPIPERSAQRILKAADLILKAGSVQQMEEGRIAKFLSTAPVEGNERTEAADAR